MVESSSSSVDTIQAGTGVMVKKAKNLKYVYVEEGKKEKMDNFFFPCKDLIGKVYGTAFKVAGRDLEVIDPVQVEEHRAEYEKLAAGETTEVTQDNRDIVDNSETQKLDKKTIMGFRDGGMEGEKIVEKLIENSATFKGRTEFSQAKYLKKKEKKYLKHFVVLRPTARLLCEMYFTRAPDKILDMRPDTLAQILTWSNVQNGSNAMVVDSCKGLVMGGVIERLGGQGAVLQMHQGNEPVRTVVEQMNFTVEQVEQVACSFSMNKLELLKKLLLREQKEATAVITASGDGEVTENSPTDANGGQVNSPSGDDRNTMSCEDMLERILGRNFKNDEDTVAAPVGTNNSDNDNKNSDTVKSTTTDTVTSMDGVVVEDDSSKTIITNIKKEEVSDEKDEKESGTKEEDSIKPQQQQQRNYRHDRKRKFDGEAPDQSNQQQQKHPRVSFLSRDRRRAECIRAMDMMRAKRFDSLIIASKYHPKKVLLSLFEYLSDSRPFVVYCQYEEPLMECYVTLKDMRCAVNVELTETWCRNMQVLTDRSHPEIVMSATSGYLLRGIKVKP